MCYYIRQLLFFRTIACHRKCMLNFTRKTGFTYLFYPLRSFVKAMSKVKFKFAGNYPLFHPLFIHSSALRVGLTDRRRLSYFTTPPPSTLTSRIAFLKSITTDDTNLSEQCSCKIHVANLHFESRLSSSFPRFRY